METDIIFLDTSIFETENFFRGHKLAKIAELSKKEIVNAKITEITRREVRSRMYENLKKASTSIRKAENLMDNEAKILKNLTEYGKYYPINRFDLENVHISLCKRFDDFLTENKIQVIGLDDSSVADVFEKYFSYKKPFGIGKKKSEFPDAFTLDIITKWCEKTEKKAYVIAIDGDITEYECEKGLIITKHDIAEFLELLAKKEKSVLLINSLEDSIDDSLDELMKYFTESEYFEDLPYELNQKLLMSSNFDDVDSYTPTITNSEIEESYIIELDDKEGIVSFDLLVRIDFTLPIDYYNYDSAWHDSEDDVWYGRIRVERNLECTIKVRLEGEYYFDFNDETKSLESFELNEIKEFDLEEFDYEDDDYY